MLNTNLNPQSTALEVKTLTITPLMQSEIEYRLTTIMAQLATDSLFMQNSIE
jgi:hypothetical protein